MLIFYCHNIIVLNLLTELYTKDLKQGPITDGWFLYSSESWRGCLALLGRPSDPVLQIENNHPAAHGLFAFS